jgi:hypothetical protein
MSKRNVALVQGPPGTGKTTVFESAVNASVDRMGGDTVMVYLSPTNRLVEEMLEKVAFVYKVLGKSKTDIANEIRVYGSQFNFEPTYAKMNLAPDNQVKLIITTEYQRIFASHERATSYHLMIDEASKSPVHAPFIALADSLLTYRGETFASINVIGDPQQAIALPEEYRGQRGKTFLIMNAFLRGLLDDRTKQQVDKKELDLLQAARDTLQKYFSFLNTSWRMPHPSEVPISKGYYNGLLKSKFTAGEVIKELWDSNIAAKVKNANKDMEFVVGKLEEGLTTDIPSFYVKTSGFKFDNEFENDVLYDPFRARAGLAFATGLAAITGKRTAVLTTYTDQWTQMKIDYYENFAHILSDNGRRKDLVTFGTIHRWLGAESDNVIAILGKESRGTQDQPTIYFQEPELLNVQLSRHLKTLTVVGDLGKLIKTVNQVHKTEREITYNNMKLTGEELIAQAGLERTNETVRKVRSGDACVYAPWPAATDS